MRDEKRSAIRKANLKEILKGYRTKAEFAAIVGVTNAQMSQLSGNNDKYQIGFEMARRIEEAAVKPEQWLDIDHSVEAGRLPETDIIVRAVSIFNEVIYSMDINPANVNRGVYEDQLAAVINYAVSTGVANKEQVQYALLLRATEGIKAE